MALQEGMVRPAVIMTEDQFKIVKKAIGKRKFSDYVRELLAEHIEGFENTVAPGVKTQLPTKPE